MEYATLNLEAGVLLPQAAQPPQQPLLQATPINAATIPPQFQQQQQQQQQSLRCNAAAAAAASLPLSTNEFYDTLFSELADITPKIEDVEAMDNNPILVSQAGFRTNRWMEDASNLKPFMDVGTKPFMELDEIEEVQSFDDGSSSVDGTQNLIDEMEDFLTYHERGGDQRLPDDDEKDSKDSAIAEQVLDALMKGNVKSSSKLNDSGYESITTTFNTSNITNVSEFTSEDGEKNVIIIISPVNSSSKRSKLDNEAADNKKRNSSAVTPVSPTAGGASTSSNSSLRTRGEKRHIKSGLGSNPDSPSSSTFSAPEDNYDSSDVDWSPALLSKTSSCPTAAGTSSSTSSVTGRRLSGRRLSRTEYGINTGAGSSASGRGRIGKKKLGILDKKERKKWQNVEAARRYRDKKKIEQVEFEVEEKMLIDKNKSLKDKLAEMENEVNTLKKLMTELGLIKVEGNGNASSASASASSGQKPLL